MSFAKMIAYRSSMPLGSVGCEGVSTTQRLLDEQSLFPTIAGDRDISKINFQQIKTVQGFWVQLVASLSLTLTGLFFSFYGCFSGRYCSGYYTMLQLRAALWIITYIVHQFIKSRHNRLKLLGYHEFLHSTYRYKRAPLQLVSLFNMLTLTAHSAALEIFGPEIFLDCNAKGLSTTLAITVLSALEFLLLLLVHVTYIVKVCVFNALQQPPDALVAQTDNGPAGGRCPTIINNQEQPLGPEEFITQQFLMIAKRMDDNRHLQDKIREYRSTAPMINSESTHLSMANQSLIEL
ncbi:uncharacterized protein LOC129739201 isoform X1 [Uranotaenia lowii]|uniref:uncharacterized protein LOC129739201 isoform X1 n=1 Tax=Uranotaenia lowii TaxID=190385 RepID=UPI002478EFDA|nr:uncharacterized protein LOC129739201 isoform X1 [Uranotaenia lowii]